MTFSSKKLGAAVVAAFCCTPLAAEQSTGRGANPQAQANMNFQVDMRDFIRFRVGAEDAVINTLVFDLDTVLNAGGIGGDGSVLNGSGGDIDPTKAQVTVQLISNVGDVNITETNNNGGLKNAGGLIIPFTEVETVSVDGSLAPPALSNAGGTVVTVTADPAVNQNAGVGSANNHPGAINRRDVWTYSFLNQGIYEPGSYTATVTYTASAAP